MERRVYLRNGVPVRRITSGTFDHTLDRSEGMGYVNNTGVVDAEFVRSGKSENEIATTPCRVSPHLRPPYDPRTLRVRTWSAQLT